MNPAWVLEEARAVTRQHRIELVVLFVPTAFRVYKDPVAGVSSETRERLRRSFFWNKYDLGDEVENTVAPVSRARTEVTICYQTRSELR